MWDQQRAARTFFASAFPGTPARKVRAAFFWARNGDSHADTGTPINQILLICVLVFGGMGWLIKIAYAGISSFRQGQAEQNVTLAKIESELSWLRTVHDKNEAEAQAAWRKIDQHDQTLLSHEARVAKLESRVESLKAG